VLILREIAATKFDQPGTLLMRSTSKVQQRWWMKDAHRLKLPQRVHRPVKGRSYQGPDCRAARGR